MNPICPKCSQESELVTGLEMYPRRPDLYSKKFFRLGLIQKWDKI